MHHITRSQWYNKKLDQFLRSKDDELYMELYPREVDKIQRDYPDLSVFMLNMVKAHANDARYHVIITK